MTAALTSEERLAAAERVCLLYGWSPAVLEGSASDRELATWQAWVEWAELVGAGFTAPKAHPDLTDAEIIRLADKRRETAHETNQKIARLIESQP